MNLRLQGQACCYGNRMIYQAHAVTLLWDYEGSGRGNTNLLREITTLVGQLPEERAKCLPHSALAGPVACSPPFSLGLLLFLPPGDIWTESRETARFHYAALNPHVDSLEKLKG